MHDRSALSTVPEKFVTANHDLKEKGGVHACDQKDKVIDFKCPALDMAEVTLAFMENAHWFHHGRTKEFLMDSVTFPE